jgi:hypothetical protein
MWSAFHPFTRFSIIAFVLSLGLGLLSMGALGYGLYYLVRPILGNRIEELQGDSSWPSMIFAGMAWSFGFLIAGLATHYLWRFKLPITIHYLIYITILWFWILIIWWWLIEFRVVK